MTAGCFVCGHAQLSPLYPGLVKCPGCGFISAELNLEHSELSRLYRKEYFFGNEYCDYLADKEILQLNFRLRLRVLRRHIIASRHRRLLEIGSAYGFFLELAKCDFGSVLGVDISEDGVRHAREDLGLNAIRADLLQQGLGKQEFDVVCMWDTIEHLARPDLVMETISRHLSTGALIAITTGDIESLNARWRRQKWRLIHPPTHLHYFSKRSLTLLMDRLGYEVVYCRYCGFYRSVDNILNNMALRHGAAGFFRLTRKMGIGRLKLYANLFDIMFMIARRR